MIPIIDFSDYGLNVEDISSVSEETVKGLGLKVKEAFSSVGFCYLKNHGIDEELLAKYNDVSKEFFEQPDEVKQKYARRSDVSGWVASNSESVNPERPGDFKEAFNYCPSKDPYNWPSTPEFESVSKIIAEKCIGLSFRLCDVLSLALGLPKYFLKNAHQRLGKQGNSSRLRTLYYPPITDETQLKPNQIRCGEHSDYGTITLLFQDDVGGLEVKSPGVGYVPATPIPGTVLVIIGDLMQRWTSDALVATRHRILIPEEELLRRKCRRSTLFFIAADDDFIIECLDGSNKYEPISTLDYLNNRFSEIY